MDAKYTIDQYALLHFATGVTSYFVGIDIDKFVIILIFVEVLQNILSRFRSLDYYLEWYWPDILTRQKNIGNAIIDIIFGLIGWLTAYALDIYGNKSGLYPRAFQ